MSVILQKMVHEILPPSKRPPSPNYVPANTLPSTVMAKTVKYVFTKGWVDIRSLYTLEYLVNLCGTDWFTDRLVKVNVCLLLLKDTLWIAQHPNDSKQIRDKKSLVTYASLTGSGLMKGN